MPPENVEHQEQPEAENVQAPTLEDLMAKVQRLEESNRKLEDNNAKILKEKRNREEREQAAAAAAKRRELESKPEAEQWEHRIRETETRAEKAERLYEEEKAARLRDKQDVQVLTAISAKLPDGREINPAFADYVLFKLDRGMFEVDEQGKIVKGLKEAISAVARENPHILTTKEQVKGSGPTNRSGSNQPAPVKKNENLGEFDFPIQTTL